MAHHAEHRHHPIRILHVLVCLAMTGWFSWFAWENQPGRILNGDKSGAACDWWRGHWRDDFDRAINEFAIQYAGQVTKDYKEFIDAIKGGRIDTKSEQYPEAATAFVRVKTGFPNYDEWLTRSYLKLGDVYIEMKDYNKAQEMFKIVLAKHKGDAYGKEARIKLRALK